MAGQVVYTKGPSAVETILNGSRTVTTPGTRVQLTTSSTATYEVLIQAKSTNTGLIYVGGASVASSNGISIAASKGITISVQNLNQVWLDCSVGGEGVNYMYWSNL